MKKLIFLVLFIAAVGAGQKVSAQKLEDNCAASATVIDKDPSGLNVRSKPNVGGKVIARLKHADGEILKVYVTGYSNGWVKIGGAYKDGGGGDIFQDSGWVSAKMIAVSAADSEGDSAKIYQKPNSESSVVAKVPAGTVLQLVGYNCGVFKVTYQGKIGWLKAVSE